MTKKGDWHRQLEALMQSLEGKERQRLLLHSCCAPCSSHCLDLLSSCFDITVFYYNPNITEKAEYSLRVAEQKRLLAELGEDLGVKLGFAEGAYEPERFLRTVKGLENSPEGGERCEKCFELRLEETARYAKEHGFKLFTTTLTISPLKNADLLNTLGCGIAEAHGLDYLTSDFKKRNGYKHSIELSKKYGLYRQDYCGCAFSKAERERQKKESDTERACETGGNTGSASEPGK